MKGYTRNLIGMLAATMLLSSVALFVSVSADEPEKTIQTMNTRWEEVDTFDLYDTIFMQAQGLEIATHYDVYVVPATIMQGQNLANADVSGGNERFTTNMAGELEVNVVWWFPEVADNYQVVVDDNWNGIYDLSDLNTQFTIIDQFNRNIRVTNSLGETDCGFFYGEPIYTCGENFPSNTLVAIYIVEDQCYWEYCDPLSDVSNNVEMVVTSPDGTLINTCIWPVTVAVDIGAYDVIVDVDMDGIYSIGDVVYYEAIVGVTIAEEAGRGDHIEDEIAAEYVGPPNYGNHKDYFDIGEPVYAYVNPSSRSNIPVGSRADVYVYLDRLWTDGDVLSDADDVSGGHETMSPQFNCNNQWFTLIWPAAQKVEHGYYDVIIDCDRDGRYDIGYDLLDKHTDFGFTLNDNDPIWTFMVYLDADNNLESAGIEDLNEMETVGSTERVDIVVQMDRIDGYDTSNGDWKGARRYHVTKDSDPNVISSTMVQNLGEVNMGSQNTLVNFVQWTMSNYPAYRYALVLWDHGAGWPGVCYDDTSGGDEITMLELKSAMATITNNGDDPIDLIGFDACLMAMTEVAYQLEYKSGSTAKPMAEYSVGSEELEPGDGWPYELILDDLVSDPTMEPSQLATVIVEDYVLSYTDGQPDPGDANWVTMSAVDISKIGHTSSGLIWRLDQFSLELTDPLDDPVWKSAYKSSYTSARTYTDTYMFYPEYRDLYYFAEYLSDSSNLPTGGPYNSDITTAAQNVMNAVNTAVIAEDHGSAKTHSAGLSIYFPATSAGYDASYDNLDLPIYINWDEFLDAYYLV
jgi:hypothetical protein